MDSKSQPWHGRTKPTGARITITGTSVKVSGRFSRCTAFYQLSSVALTNLNLGSIQVMAPTCDVCTTQLKLTTMAW